MGIVARRNVKKHQNSRFQPGVPESKLQIVMPGIIRVAGNDLWNESLHSKDGGCCLQLATGSALVPTMTNDLRTVTCSRRQCDAKCPRSSPTTRSTSQRVLWRRIEVLTSHEFLVHRFHLNRELLEEKLHRQAAAAGGVSDGENLQRLAQYAPKVEGSLLLTD